MKTKVFSWIRGAVFVSLILFCSDLLFSEDLEATKSGSFVSKWDRVLELAKKITYGDVPSRLQKKEEILAILLKQEPGYPIFYVDCNATGNCDGTSWKDAFTTIQPAIAAAAKSEGWVWVAKGTYTGNYWAYGKLTCAVMIKSRVMLFGGFSGTETTLDQRDWDLNETIIKNEKGPGPKGPRAVDMDHMSLIDGFTIKDSGYKDYADDAKSDDVSAGGIRTMGAFSVVRNNRMKDNYSMGGGGIAVWGGRYGQYRRTGYAPIVEQNFIYNNHGVCGAGVQLYNSEALFCNNVVYNNTHLPPPGVFQRSKGVEVVCNLGVSGRPVIVNCIVRGQRFGDIIDYSDNQPVTWGTGIKMYNCFQYGDYGGENSIKEDPRFKDANNADFTLLPDSPCIDSGHPDGPPDPDGSRADIGVFTSRYYVTIDDGGVGGHPKGAGRYTAGNIVEISVDSVVVNDLGTTRYIFLRWQGEGSGSYSGDSLTAYIRVNGPIKETVVWKVEYRLQVNSGTNADTVSGWKDTGAKITVTVPTLVDVADGERRRFVSWVGEGEYAYTGTDSSFTITMNGAVVETANWNTEYRLRIVSQFGNPNPAGDHWYVSGTTIPVTVDSVVNNGEGRRYRFVRWEGVGSGAYSGTSNSFEIRLTAPVVETALWQEQFYLKLISESNRGNPKGEAWYDKDSVAPVSIETIHTVSPQMRYCFVRWEGSIPEAYTGTDPNPSILMVGPITERAVWKVQYRIEIVLDPPQGGHVSLIPSSDGWCYSGDKVSLRAVGNADSYYRFVNWTGYVSSSTNPLEVTVNASFSLTAHFQKGRVVIKTVPPGLNFTADDSTYAAPMVFFWGPGEQHHVGVDSVVSFQDSSEQVQYIFDHWSQGEGQELDIMVTEQTVTFTAYFVARYYLKIESEYKKNTAQGEGWYVVGHEAVISIDNLTDEAGGARHRFSGWTGTGRGSVNSLQREVRLTVNGPIVQTAHWTAQYFLDVSVSPPYGGEVSLSPPDKWYDDKSAVEIKAKPANSNIRFMSWAGDTTGSANPIVVVMNTPKKIVARFNSTSNVAPQFTKSLPDEAIDEDSVLTFSFSTLGQYLTDLNDPFDQLQFFINKDVHFILEVDTLADELRFIPEPNWYGTEEIILTASDAWLSDSDTFSVVVASVNDPPGSFELLTPTDKSVFSTSETWIPFSWETSLNADVGDTILYDFFIGPDSTFIGGSTHWLVTYYTTLQLRRALIHGTVYWGVKAVDVLGSEQWCQKKWMLTVSTDAVEEQGKTPDQFVLNQNFPNPFNSGTQISYELPKWGHVQVRVFDSLGRLVGIVFDDDQNAGSYKFHWGGRDSKGNNLPSGVYVVQVRFGQNTFQKKMILLR